MKNYVDESREIINSTRAFLTEQFNTCSDIKIQFNGEHIDLFQHYDSEKVTDAKKMNKIIGCILELEGFEEAYEDLSCKDRIKKLKDLSKKIHNQFQEV